jgi:two-component system, NarL family, sensor histidine kinase DesK
MDMPPIDTLPIDEPPIDEPPINRTDIAAPGQRRPVGLEELAQREGDAFARRWWFFAGIWLVYLIDPLVNLWRYDTIAPRLLGTGLIVVFSFVYVAMVPRAFRCPPRLRLAVLGTMVAASALYFGFCGDGSAFAPYLAVVIILLLPWSSAVPLVLALVAAVTFGPGHVAAWHDSGLQWGVGLGTLFASVIVGAMRLFAGTATQLHRAEEEIEQLAAEQERLRIARDLHDLLGHALTTVTVKAELASRLVGRDPERAAREMAEVAELGRQSLTDVRAAVSGFREVSLVKELAAAREVLQAAGIDAELPAAAEDVPGDLRELFGWVVREGVTNAVRHSRARRVVVRVEGRVIQIDNDGVDDAPGRTASSVTTGHGLIGLSERVAMVGGEVRAGPEGTNGYRLRVEVPA